MLCFVALEMKRILRNRWTWILLPLPILLIAAPLLGINPDVLLLILGVLIFIAVAMLASRYVPRVFPLIYSGNVENESVHIVGWSLVFLSLMATQVLRWVAIQLGRPEWIAHQFWSADIVLSMFYGFALVVYSTRRVTPRLPTGRIGIRGFLVGLVSGIGLMLSGALPVVWKAVSTAFLLLIRAA